MPETSNPPETNPSQLKSWVMVAILSLTTILLAFPFKNLSTQTQLIPAEAGVKIGLLVLAAGLTIITLSLVALTPLQKTEIAIVCLAQTLLFAASLVVATPDTSNQAKYLYAALSIVYGISCGYYLLAAKHNINEYIHFHALKIFPRPTKVFFILITILVTVSFYWNYQSHIQKEGFSLPPNLINQLLDPAIGIAEKQLSKQVNGLIGQQFEEKLGISGEKEIMEFLKEEGIETLEEGSSREKLGLTPENLGLEQIGIGPNGELDLDPALDQVGNQIKTGIEEKMETYTSFIAPLITLLLFVLLTFFDTIATYIFAGLIATVIHILEGVGFLKRVVRKEEVERITL